MYLEANCLDGQLSDMLSGNNIVRESSNNESKTGYSITPQYSAISEHSSVKGTPEDIEKWLMQLPVDSLVNHFQLQEISSENSIQETDGLKRLNAYALYDQESATLKMLQLSFLPDTSKKYSVIFTKWGTMCDGVCYQLESWEPIIEEIDYGFSVPTPQSRDWKGKSQRAGQGNTTDCLPNAIGGIPNPEWVELIMGHPTGHTDLKPLEMHKYQYKWLQLFKHYLKELFK